MKRNCWLWKGTFDDLEIWVGDARDDNFVETPKGIVPIDVRVWSYPDREAWLQRLDQLRASVGTGKQGTSTEAKIDDLRSEPH